MSNRPLSERVPIIATILFFLSLFSFPLIGLAQSSTTTSTNLTYTPLEPLPGAPSGFSYTDLASYLNYLFPVLIAAGAFLAVALIAWNGVRFMLSEVVTEKNLAKKRISAALWGLILLVSSVLILNTINPQLINFNLQSLGQL